MWFQNNPHITRTTIESATESEKGSYTHKQNKETDSYVHRPMAGMAKFYKCEVLEFGYEVLVGCVGGRSAEVPVQPASCDLQCGGPPGWAGLSEPPHQLRLYRGCSVCVGVGMKLYLASEQSE